MKNVSACLNKIIKKLEPSQSSRLRGVNNRSRLNLTSTAAALALDVAPRVSIADKQPQVGDETSDKQAEAIMRRAIKP